MPVPQAGRRESAAAAGVDGVGGASPLMLEKAGAQAEDLSPCGVGLRVVARPPHPGVRRQVPESAHVGTRKMVNYARPGRSQRKLWWRSEAVLTCKSTAAASELQRAPTSQQVEPGGSLPPRRRQAANGDRRSQVARESHLKVCISGKSKLVCVP